jgi:hypothetical protein
VSAYTIPHTYNITERNYFAYLSVGEIDLGGGGNDISLVDTSHGDTVDLVGTSDQQETRVESLDADNTLTTETSSQKDDDGTGGNGSADSTSLGSLARLLGLGDILSGVETAGLVGRDNTLLATLEFDSLVSGSVLGSSLNLGLLVLVESLSSVDSATRVTGNTGSQKAVSGCGGHF